MRYFFQVIGCLIGALIALTAVERPVPLAIDGTPSAEEVLCLLHLNHLRADPEWECERILFGAQGGMSSMPPFLDVAKCRNELRALAAESKTRPFQPLAFNLELMKSARLHARYMMNNDVQSHAEIEGMPGFTGISSTDRIRQTNYAGDPMGENVFLRAVSPWNSQRGFIIDWGPDPDGMQTPRGHRLACLANTQREVGIGVIRYDKDMFMSTCHNFGNNRQVPRILSGVVYNDINKNAVYDVGEGLADIHIHADSGEQTTTWPSGAFTLELQHQGDVLIQIKNGEQASWSFSAGRHDLFIETTAPLQAEIDQVAALLSQYNRADAANQINALDLWWQTRCLFKTQAQIEQIQLHSADALKQLRAAQIQAMQLFSEGDKRAYLKKLSVIEAPFKASLAGAWFSESRQAIVVYCSALELVVKIRATKRVTPAMLQRQVSQHRQALHDLHELDFIEVLNGQILLMERALRGGK